MSRSYAELFGPEDQPDPEPEEEPWMPLDDECEEAPAENDDG